MKDLFDEIEVEKKPLPKIIPVIKKKTNNR